MSRYRQPRNIQNNRSMTVEQAAQSAGCNASLLREMFQRGQGPVGFTDGNGAIRYRPESVNAWLRSTRGAAR